LGDFSQTLLILDSTQLLTPVRGAVRAPQIAALRYALRKPSSIAMLAFLFALAGVYVRIADAMERALAPDSLPIERRGVGYGALT